ncbi:hypothetical protein HXX76_006189 [Chlamydomonas incerta]|uniref:Uncharacterized protein n=1 Tax=Chlamydomonas incerta TaxID=51695 RepID=A0A835W5Q9_CHLIN|nr:hypothetical protein HXX76_006189 [Chlamydomonas incerta]|eukprot:KAG2436661.1 hypothetical protein HXX76_006189 [Chlamydomonas incerta]
MSRDDAGEPVGGPGAEGAAADGGGHGAADHAPAKAAAAPGPAPGPSSSLPSRSREKPLLRLLALVAARAHALGLLLLLAALCGLLALPLLDRSVGFDEKGLLAGLAAPTIGQAAAGGQLMRAARRIARSATAAATATTSRGRTVAAFQSPGAPAALAAALAAAGLNDTQLTRPLVRLPRPLLPPPGSGTGSGLHSGQSSSPLLCRCANVHTLIRARRGDGLEALAVVTPVAFSPPPSGAPAWPADPSLDGRAQTAAGAELGLAAGAALALHLAAPAEAAGGGGRWLARDVLWVVPDLSCGVSACLAAWVDSYTGGGGGGGGGQGAAGSGGGGRRRRSRSEGADAGVDAGGRREPCEAAVADAEDAEDGEGETEVVLRGGVIQQAVVLEALAGGGGGGQAAELLVVGSGGLLPKLDMMWLLRYMFGWPTTPVLWRDDGRLEGAQAAVAAAWRQLTGGSAGAAAGFASRLLHALQFAWQQAVGRPAGAHAAFKEAGVDAAGLRLVPGRHDPWTGAGRPIRASDPSSSSAAASASPAAAASSAAALEERALSLASGLELTLRSLNNLVERVHHSSFLYLLAGLDRYVSVERYVGPAAALALAVQLQAAWSMRVVRLTGVAAAAVGAGSGGSGGAGPALWGVAAARAAARTAACAAAAAALRVLACGDGPEAARLLAARLLQLAPAQALAALQAALVAPLSSPEGAAAAAAVVLLTSALAAGAAAAAGRLAAAAAEVAGAGAANRRGRGRRASSGSGAGARSLAGAASASAAGVTAAGALDGAPLGASGADAAAASSIAAAAAAASLRWHAERVLVVTAAAAALAALVCLNWAAAAVAGFHLAKLALMQGLAAAAGGGCGGARLRLQEQPRPQPQAPDHGNQEAAAPGRGGQEAAARGPGRRRRSLLGRCAGAAAWALGSGMWLVASPLTGLLLVVAMTEAAGLGGGLRSGGGLAAAVDSALGWGLAPGVCLGLSAANYWFAAVVAAPFWLFGLEGWLAQAPLWL